jgi:DNA replication protein DnaC
MMKLRGWLLMVELEHSRELLSNFGLTTAAELLDARLEAASQNEMTYIAFLHRLLEAEEQKRKQRSEKTRLKLSRLPHRKTLDEFDFSFQPSIDTRLMSELATLAFVARNENVIFLGLPALAKHILQ